MDEKELREYVRRAHKEGRKTSWIADAVGIDHDQVWQIIFGQPRSAGAVVEWPNGYIELADGRRFQRYTKHGIKKIRRLPEPVLSDALAEPDEPAPKTWLELHDDLIKEWFDGELALIDDLYPEPPRHEHLHHVRQVRERSDARRMFLACTVATGPAFGGLIWGWWSTGLALVSMLAAVALMLPLLRSR